ncbi:MAG: DUF4105 domain-containing protein, partial [Myxococcales bacterium]|nr:DUF4105 domain-containing protein [Myxococcales bacterium]
FLAEKGAKDPGAELRATLTALIAPPLEDDDAIHCRFPARALWLAEALDVPPATLAPTPCPALDDWRAELDPRGITMIFPEAFMNNPASIFGHTLLRLDVADPSDPQNLLAYAIDFTAQTGGDAGPIFFAKGAFGRYPGLFGIAPYYEKLSVYAAWQNRDIWEYPLDFSPEELELVLLHLWELDDVAIPYYFFLQNCAYQLIRLLAVAHPNLDMRHGSPLGTMPVDTVRDVIDEIGLASEPRYRPSPATQLKVQLDALDPEAEALVLSVARGTTDPGDTRIEALTPGERAVLLGTAYDVLRYEYLQIENPDEDIRIEVRDRTHALLVARSRAPSGVPASPPTPARPPEEGHGTALVSMGAGVEDDAGFIELRFRPTLHGILEPVAGFPGDSTVGLLDTRVRYFPNEGRVRLEELVLVELRSNSPRDGFFKPWSWGLETGARTRLFPDDGDLDRSLVWRTGGSLGLTWQPGQGPLTVYARGDLWLEVGPGWDGSWALGPGLEVGAELAVPNDRWMGRLFARGAYFAAGDRETELEVGLGQRLTLTHTTALVGEVSYQYFAGESWLDAQLSLQWTF